MYVNQRRAKCPWLPSGVHDCIFGTGVARHIQRFELCYHRFPERTLELWHLLLPARLEFEPKPLVQRYAGIFFFFFFFEVYASMEPKAMRRVTLV